MKGKGLWVEGSHPILYRLHVNLFLRDLFSSFMHFLHACYFSQENVLSMFRERPSAGSWTMGK